jgi:hypothetical protein
MKAERYCPLCGLIVKRDITLDGRRSYCAMHDKLTWMRPLVKQPEILRHARASMKKKNATLLKLLAASD